MVRVSIVPVYVLVPAPGLDLEVLPGRSAANTEPLDVLTLRFMLRAGEVKRPLSEASGSKLQHTCMLIHACTHNNIPQVLVYSCISCSLFATVAHVLQYTALH